MVPHSEEGEELRRRLLDASAALWNEITDERRENYADSDGDVWEISEYRGRYGGILDAPTIQQIEWKNSEASRQQQTTVARPMARPVCLKWDDHEWSASPRAHRPNEERTNPQVASVGR